MLLGECALKQTLIIILKCIRLFHKISKFSRCPLHTKGTIGRAFFFSCLLAFSFQTYFFLRSASTFFSTLSLNYFNVAIYLENSFGLLLLLHQLMFFCCIFIARAKPCTKTHFIFSRTCALFLVALHILLYLAWAESVVCCCCRFFILASSLDFKNYRQAKFIRQHIKRDSKCTFNDSEVALANSKICLMVQQWARRTRA